MNRYLYFAVFSSGMTVLALELAASRLLGSAFGTSNLVWASIIGLILIYLTFGYFIGGRWADRWPYPGTMYTVMAWGAFSAGLIPAIARPVLRLAASAERGSEHPLGRAIVEAAAAKGLRLTEPSSFKVVPFIPSLIKHSAVSPG